MRAYLFPCFLERLDVIQSMLKDISGRRIFAVALWVRLSCVIPSKVLNIANCGNLTECHFCVSWFAFLQTFRRKLRTNRLVKTLVDLGPGSLKTKDTLMTDPHDYLSFSESRSAGIALAAFIHGCQHGRDFISHKHYRFKFTFRGFCFRFIHRLLFHRLLVARRAISVIFVTRRCLLLGLTRISLKMNPTDLFNSFFPSTAYISAFESASRNRITWAQSFRTSLPKIAMGVPRGWLEPPSVSFLCNRCLCWALLQRLRRESLVVSDVFEYEDEFRLIISNSGGCHHKSSTCL